MRRHLKEALAEMQMMHTASCIVEAGLIDFSANLSDLGDMVAKLIIIGTVKDPQVIESAQKTASTLFACQQQIDEAIRSADRIQNIIEEFRNIDFPE